MGLRGQLTAAALVSGCVALALAPAASAKCTPGVHTHGGVTSRTFCGPASAHVVAAGASWTIKGGQCQKAGNYVTINIGTVTLSPSAPNKPNYFGITVGKVPGGGGKPAGKDGTYTGGAVSFVFKHKSYAVTNSVVKLTGNRTKGTFSGTLFGGGAASGTFSCG